MAPPLPVRLHGIVLNKHRDNFTLPLPVGFVTVEINKIVTLNDNVTFVKTIPG
jgi:hypothetical protein